MEKTKKEKLFSKAIHKWVNKTWLGWWKIDISYHTAFEYSRYEAGDDVHKSIAFCATDWRYMFANIHVNSDLLEEQDEKDIEEIALHELMHVFLNEMREEGIEHEERVATFLTRSFLTTEKHNG